MRVAVRLLGHPVIESASGRPQPRGQKVWALLGYLALSDRPPTRRHLASLLFPDADDPLRTLRWNVSELRRSLDGIGTLGGDPLVIAFSPGSAADVRLLLEGSPERALDLDGFGLEFLEGICLPTAPAFEAWLAAERCRLDACTDTVLLERALDLLAAGAAEEAARLAAKAVARSPLNPDHHAVLVRSLRAAGARTEAHKHALRCAELFRRELGCAPPPEVLAAAGDGEPPLTRRAATPAVAISFLEAARASLTAGAVDRGLDQLGRAMVAATEGGGSRLRAEVSVTLAGARIHSTGERGTAVRGLLHEAVRHARQAGAGDLVAAAGRELAFLALQQGRHDRALVHLDEGQRVTTSDAELARLLGVRGMCLTDTADYGPALDTLVRSVALARATRDPLQAAWSTSMLGRLHVLRGEHERAVVALDEALATIAAHGWTAFRPWPQTFRAEAAIELGDLPAARELLDSAWVLATESRDHCWMATVARGQAALALREGDPARGQRWCTQGLAPTPWYLWPYARLLEMSCLLALRGAPASVDDPFGRLTELAGRANMRELLVLAHLHRARAGTPDALGTARALAAGIDSVALHARVAGGADAAAGYRTRSKGRIRADASESNRRSCIDRANRSVMPET